MMKRKKKCAVIYGVNLCKQNRSEHRKRETLHICFVLSVIFFFGWEGRKSNVTWLFYGGVGCAAAVKSIAM